MHERNQEKKYVQRAVILHRSKHGSVADINTIFNFKCGDKRLFCSLLLSFVHLQVVSFFCAITVYYNALML